MAGRSTSGNQQDSVNVPRCLITMLQEFTVACLRVRPQSYTSFAVEFFTQRDRGGMEFYAELTHNEVLTPMEFPIFKIDATDDADRVSDAGKQRRRSVFADKIATDNIGMESAKLKSFNKTEPQRRLILNSLNTFMFFRAFDSDQVKAIIDSMTERRFKAGETLISHSEPEGDTMYILESGSFDVFMSISGNKWKIGSCKASIDDLAPLTGTPRNSFIVVTEPAVAWKLDRSMIKSVVLNRMAEAKLQHSFLFDNCTLLKPLNDPEKMSFADSLKVRTFREGDRIFLQGDSGSCMYFVIEGVISIKIRSSVTRDKDIEVKKCYRGDYFGELAPMYKKQRAATATASKPCKLACLEGESLDRLLSPCMEQLKRTADGYPAAVERAANRANRTKNTD